VRREGYRVLEENILALRLWTEAWQYAEQNSVIDGYHAITIAGAVTDTRAFTITLGAGAEFIVLQQPWVLFAGEHGIEPHIACSADRESSQTRNLRFEEPIRPPKPAQK